MRRVEGGYLADNIGRFRIFENLSEGWKPVAIESNHREVGQRMTHVMSGPRQQLVTAEGMMFNVANELFVEPRVAYGLWYGEPKVMSAWDAVGQYNRFFAAHREYYLAPGRGPRWPWCSTTAARASRFSTPWPAARSLYNVLYEHELTPARLTALRRRCAVERRDDAQRGLGRRRAIRCSRAAGCSWPRGRRCGTSSGVAARRPARLEQTPDKFRIVRWQPLPAVDEMARQLQAALPAAEVRLDAPPSVLYNVTGQQSGRRMVHLLNYSSQPAGRIVVSVAGHFDRVMLLTPEGPAATPAVRAAEIAPMIEIPALKIYALLVLP